MGGREGSLENMVSPDFWKNRRVAITGHTGFKGSWLSFWLLEMQAVAVYGFSQAPETSPALFGQLDLASCLNHQLGDIRNTEQVQGWLQQSQPDVLFHLAAQPLVRRSYREPLLTWQTNVLGTLNVLEAVKTLDKPCALVIVTTDKVYENREWIYAYREKIDWVGMIPTVQARQPQNWR